MKNEKQPARMPSNNTRASILTYLLGEDLSAINLEDKLGINESAIRRHLDTLEQRGYVKHYFEKASKGRPKKFYSITSLGRKVFPQKTHLLFKLLARRVREKHGEKELKKLLSMIATDFADRLAPEEPPETEEERIEKFVDSLERFGFYPTMSKREGAYYITYQNCVFEDVIDELCNPLCEMHRKIVEKIIPNSEVLQKKCIGEGDKRCVHRIIVGDS